MLRVLLIQPSLQPPGGGNGVAAWMIEALQDTCAVSVLTWAAIDLDSVNRYYGTRLTRSQFTALRVPWPSRRAVDLLPTPGEHLKRALMLRQARAVAERFDVLLTANNEADFGRRGIQYVHFPWAFRPRPPEERRFYHLGPLVDAYYRLCDRIAGLDSRRVRENLTLTNSRWTADRVRERWGIESTVLHPPVAGDFPDVPWQDREDGFVCVGRFSPEKQLDRVVALVEAVRVEAPEVHLHLVGSRDDPATYARLRSLANDRPWLSLDEGLSRPDLLRLLARHRWGVHGMPEEHFGIAVAELVRAGCLTFAPAGGGPPEILGHDALLYRTVAEGADKIRRVRGDPSLADSLRAHLATRARALSSDHFVESFRALVHAWPG